MAADDADITKPVRGGCHILVLMPDNRPDLPAGESVTVANVKEGKQIIVRHHIRFAGLAVDREHDKEDFISGQPVLEVSIERNKCGVVFRWIIRALLEIDWKQRESPGCLFPLVLATGKAQ